jgi:hypothetical protein
VQPFLSLVALFSWLAFAGQDTPETKKPDTFFTGSVVETTAEKIVVSRVVLGKTEKRTFRLTVDTKVDGKLKTKVKVTVLYEASDDGEIATQIFVRQDKKK